MRVVELADELGLTTVAALERCGRAGVAVSSGDEVLTDEQVAAVRAAGPAPASSPPDDPSRGFAPPGAHPPVRTGPLPAPPGNPGGQTTWGPPPGAAAWPPPPGAAPGWYAPGWGPPPQPAKTDGFAIATLISAFLCFPISWVLGIVALRRIRTSNGTLTGNVLVYIALPFTFVGFLVFIIVMLGEPVEDDRSPTFEPFASTDGPEALADRMEIGACYETPTQALIFAVEEVPCDGPHGLEVYDRLESPEPRGEPYPGEDDLGLLAITECGESFEDFVGVPYGTSEFDIYYIYPPNQGWVLGERTIVCAVSDPTGDQLTGSAEGTGR